MSWTHVQTFSQNAQYAGTPVNNTQVTLASPVSVGDLITAWTCVGASGFATAPSSMTDSLGNTYTRLPTASGGRQLDASNSEGVDAWYCFVTNAGTPTITYDPNSSADAPWIAIKGSHYTGSDGSSTLRASKGNVQTNPGTSANAITTSGGTGDLTAVASGDLLVCGGGNPGSGGTGTMAAGTGFTGSTIDSTTGLLDEFKTADGSETDATFTDATNGGGHIYPTIAMAFSPAAGASASAAITGTAGDGCGETDIVSGGQTVVITLTGDTWVASGATFDAQRQNIIDGLDSAQSEATGWNAEVRDNLAVTTVVRTSNTVVTITLSAAAAYAITANETITVTVPGSALTGASPLTATPTFVVTATAAAGGPKLLGLLGVGA